MSESSSDKEQTQPANDTNLNYWLDSWQNNKIGFHRKIISKLFQSYLIPKLTSSEQKQLCVVFPLCGKTLDMIAVLDNGHRVIGIEGSQTAINAFFNENNISYEIENDESNQCQIYKGTDRPITIYCTDFCSFNKTLPSIDYIWDRGGLVAINPLDREPYRDCLLRMMTREQTQLFLVAINYNDPDYTPPPHILSDDNVNNLFGNECSIELLEVHDETDEFNGRVGRQAIKQIEERIHLVIRKSK
ncbi:unnamed protein product [Adineta steineri]|uniref:thiopurine S-methyltransferase n=1 Tax=Adineta steineri TaxID=433720 RepID=A0A813XCN1_9BILA|nr:unnamed protein product [Adineta steineri]CAF1610026.1 unnamed protein product [Adineta steineri]